MERELPRLRVVLLADLDQYHRGRCISGGLLYAPGRSRLLRWWGDLRTESLGAIPFTVAGSGVVPQPVAAPALDAYGLALLLLGLIGIVWWERRQRVSYWVIRAAALPMSIRADAAQGPNNFSGFRGDVQ
jgi:hypothetical protein